MSGVCKIFSRRRFYYFTAILCFYYSSHWKKRYQVDVIVWCQTLLKTSKKLTKKMTDYDKILMYIDIEDTEGLYKFQWLFS